MDGTPDDFSAEGVVGKRLWNLHRLLLAEAGEVRVENDLASRILGELDELDTYAPEVILSSIRTLCQQEVGVEPWLEHEPAHDRREPDVKALAGAALDFLAAYDQHGAQSEKLKSEVDALRRALRSDR